VLPLFRIDIPHTAPANVALKWKDVLWEAAVQDELTEFQGVPNAKNNKLWDDLFNGERFSIPGFELLLIIS
jgi:hypothetical protein